MEQREADDCPSLVSTLDTHPRTHGTAFEDAVTSPRPVPLCVHATELLYSMTVVLLRDHSHRDWVCSLASLRHPAAQRLCSHLHKTLPCEFGWGQGQVRPLPV